MTRFLANVQAPQPLQLEKYEQKTISGEDPLQIHVLKNQTQRNPIQCRQTSKFKIHAPRQLMCRKDPRQNSCPTIDSRRWSGIINNYCRKRSTKQANTSCEGTVLPLHQK